MPSSKAILRDIADRKLDPNKNYTKSNIDSSGRVKVKRDVAEVAPAEDPTSPVEQTTEKTDVSKKSVKIEKATKKSAAGSSAKGKSLVDDTSASVALEGTISVENSVEQDKPQAAEVSTEVGDSDNS